MKVGHEKPVDQTAALVVSRGEHFEYVQLGSELCTPLPPHTKPVESDEDNLAGIKFGRLTVIGRHDAGKIRWVCRCVCGNYVLRRPVAIQAAAHDSACPQCYLMAVSKRNEYIRRTGKEKHTREFM